MNAIHDGLALLTWEQETFAFADAFDEVTGRYRGLRGGKGVPLSDTEPLGLLVKPEVARIQLDAESPADVGPSTGPPAGGEGPAVTEPGTEGTKPPEEVKPQRFHGTVVLDSTRVGRDAGLVADEVIAHLTGLVGAEVTVTLEVEARIPSGAPDQVVRTVTENSRTLRFTSHGFEKE